MRQALDLAYAQARIQARFAALSPEAEWQRLETSRTLASFLEEARNGPLRDWVKGFSSQSDAHDLEAGVRVLFGEILEAVAGWVPASWREAVSWVWWLMPLPLLSHLQRGGAIPDWVAGDPILKSLVGSQSELNAQVLEDAGARRLLQSDTDPVAVWSAEWSRRRPNCSRETSRSLEALKNLLVDHVAAFSRCSPESAWHLREGLRERLRLHFHEQPLQPTIPFIYLALTALDLERLRAVLVTRLLFRAQDEPARPDVTGRLAA